MKPTSHFDLLLQAAAAQPDPQRLLFVFAAAGLPDDATPAQRQGFEAGTGGELAPLMCVDKAPDELADFDALATESASAGPPWQVVFAAGLAGRGGRAPTRPQVDEALQAMVERVRSGRLDGLLALDRAGHPLRWC
ncbi:MAG: ribonucleotide reductase subunit alpha [Burkholderiaceae bacterium]